MKEKHRKTFSKKSFICCILIFITLFLPVCSNAEVLTSVNNSDNTSYTPNVTYQYKQDEQKVLEGVPEIGCKAAYIAEPTTGKVIYEKNAHEKMYPASTTKILTALVVLENCDVNDKAKVSQNAINLVPPDYSNAKLKAGEEVSISDLLKALLIPSANEAANVLAEHVSGSVEDFAVLCNKRAGELGCETLHFVNPNGLHDENHYCSAYDLYLVAKECIKHAEFNEIVSMKSFTLPATNAYPRADRTFKNRNEMLLPGTYYYSYCTGIKTGHTEPAGECLVASSSYNDMEFISVVLGGKTRNKQGLNERFYDTKQLFEFGYNNYSIKKIANYGETVASIEVGKAVKEEAALDLIVDTDISTVVPNDVNKENVSTSVSINENIVAPIEQNQVLGQITYSVDGLVYTTNIIASHQVKKLPYEQYNLIVVTVGVAILFIISAKAKSSKKRKNRYKNKKGTRA